MSEFTSKQKEIVARKLGYDGPMQGFDEFIASSPALQAKYSMVTQKYVERMAKGGVVKKYAFGGVGRSRRREKEQYREPTAPTYTQQPADGVGILPDEPDVGSYVGTDEGDGFNTPPPQVNPDIPEQNMDDSFVTNPTQDADVLAGAPNIASVPKMTATTVSDADAQSLLADTTTAAPATTAAVSTQAGTEGVTAPGKVTADAMTADTAQTGVQTELDKMQQVQGTVSEKAQVDAATVVPTETAVSDLQAAQGTATRVEGVDQLRATPDQLVSGSAVEQARVDEAMAKNVAAQGQVTEEMTVQGQMNTLLSDFDAGNPPPWAAGAMRAATAQLAARGLGASSMAGQAIIQATIEAATPIAAADAAVFKEMGLQNLTNRQAMAVLTAQQRATFLGQEFDQNFQTRVLNAARIADVADKNFDATVQIALENSRLASTMNIANLNNKQALIIEQAGQIANLETKNLDNLQAARVQNAKAFLDMDMANLDIKQQNAMFKAKTITDTITSDAAAKNAAKATNATNKLKADEINSTLALSASYYNAQEKNKVAVANMEAANEIAKFNAQEANDRAEFNAEQTNAINVANAKILADISTTNTKEINAANAVNAKNATDLSSTVYSQLSQTYRDKLEMSFKAGENDADRAVELVKASLSSYTSIAVANKKADAESSASIGGFITNVALEFIKAGKNPLDFFE